GNWYVNSEDSARAIAHHEQALALVAEENSPELMLESIDLLAMASLLGMRPNAARRHYEQSTQMARALGEQRLLSTALLQLAVMPTFSDLSASVPPFTPQQCGQMAV